MRCNLHQTHGVFIVLLRGRLTTDYTDSHRLNIEITDLVFYKIICENLCNLWWTKLLLETCRNDLKF